MLVGSLEILSQNYWLGGTKSVLTIHFSGVMLIMTPKDESLGCLGKTLVHYYYSINASEV